MIEHPVQVEESQLHAPSRCGTIGPTAHLFQCFAKMELNPNKVENLWSWEKKILKAEIPVLVIWLQDDVNRF